MLATWNARPMPWRTMSGGVRPTISTPLSRIWPASGFSAPVIRLKNVLLPAPLGPMVGTVLLLILNDTVTRLTEYYGIVLGIVILFFAIGLRKGLMDFVVEWYAQRRGEAEE